jgi:hypothetical protein
MSGDVVGVPDRGIAPRGAAGVIAGDEELPGGVREVAAFGVAVDQVPGGGVGVEAADPGFQVRAGRADQLSGDGRGDRAVADQGGFVVAVERHAVGHHELDVEVDSGRDGRRVGLVVGRRAGVAVAGPTGGGGGRFRGGVDGGCAGVGHAVDEFVGHQLAVTVGVTSRFGVRGVCVQGRVDGDAVRDGQQRGIGRSWCRGPGGW